MKNYEDGQSLGVVYAGGTISSLATEHGFRIGGIKVDLISELQEHSTASLKNIHINSSEFAYTGLSENIDKSHQLIIGRKVDDAFRSGSNTVLITHGTDSMEHTARYLQSRFAGKLVKHNQKIILTGANQDLRHPQTDAWANLEFALQSVVALKNNPGVYVAFHNELIPADFVVKEPFDGNGMNYIDIRSSRFRELSMRQNNEAQARLYHLGNVLPQISYSHAVIEYQANRVVTNHDGLLENVTSDTRAILFTLYHSGTANTQNPEISISGVVKKLRQENGILSFGVTENGEPLDLHQYETSVQLREAGMIPLYNMLAPVAKEKIIRLSDLPSAQMIMKMLTNLSGEIDESQIHPADVATLLKLYNQ